MTFSSWFYGSNFIDHIRTVWKDKVWAEEVELIATASYFNTTIWGFTNCYPVGGPWKWIKIEPEECHPDDPPFDGIPPLMVVFTFTTLAVSTMTGYCHPQPLLCRNTCYVYSC